MGFRRSKPAPQGEEFVRVRTPNQSEGEIVGVVEEMLGGGRMRVHCADGVVRLTRIPGKIKRFTWVRLGDYVLVKPWPNENDKADLAYRYIRQQVSWLQKKGYLQNL
ncbi:MAG TPA: translation initiation factor eIF-1A [archaeon]|nr:translation initiation factor eIF-1A [archaeon]HLD80416.1 translation initiation factor eIF-1A [archaeon]